MATRRLYYDDSFQREFDARVLSCEAFQGHSEPDENAPFWNILLESSAFYPTSGGQPFDKGKIGEANVLDVREDDDGEIIHIVDRWIANGDVLGCVNWPRRFDHMQQHTGQHLLSARSGLVYRRFHFIWAKKFAPSICVGENLRGTYWKALNAQLTRLFLKTVRSRCAMELLNSWLKSA